MRRYPKVGERVLYISTQENKIITAQYFGGDEWGTLSCEDKFFVGEGVLDYFYADYIIGVSFSPDGEKSWIVWD